jgi:F420H(2)-dependent quinone reductase
MPVASRAAPSGARAVYGRAVRDYRPQADKTGVEKLLQAFAKNVHVTIDGRRRPMRARIAEGEERERLWAMACDNYSGYARYQRRAGDRVIPVIALLPR